jgi:hypothetical protein
MTMPRTIVLAVVGGAFLATGAEWASCDDTTNVPSISGSAAEAGGARYTCKNNLRNKWSIYVRAVIVGDWLPVSEGAVITDWCYYTAGRHGIRSRNSNSYAACTLPVGGC